MNTVLKTILIVVVVLLIAGALFLVGAAFGRPGALPDTSAPAWPQPYAYRNDIGPGMMRGWQSMGPGYMHGGQSGFRYGMGPGMMQAAPYAAPLGPGMMQGYGWRGWTSETAAPLTVDEARQAAVSYIGDLNTEGLEPGEVMIFDNNAYVAVMESSTGIGAFELLVDPLSKTAFPEHGPNMMWNLKYGALNHAGMMRGRGMMGAYWPSPNTTPADVTAEMPVTVEQARDAAQAFLDQYAPGTTVSADPVTFYGYFTFDFERNGRLSGMLSVNGYNAQVFPHTWHGTFVEEAEE